MPLLLISFSLYQSTFSLSLFFSFYSFKCINFSGIFIRIFKRCYVGTGLNLICIFEFQSILNRFVSLVYLVFIKIIYSFNVPVKNLLRSSSVGSSTHQIISPSSMWIQYLLRIFWNTTKSVRVGLYFQRWLDYKHEHHRTLLRLKVLLIF